MAKAKANFFKLDTNVDGTYSNEDGDVITIPNMIQVVGATDGAAAFPNNEKKVSNLDPAEINSIPDLTNVVGISGHGILYDEKGRPYAYKGDLVFRDGRGNKSSLSRLINKVNSINKKGNELFLRDSSLQEYNTSDSGIELNELIDAAIFRSGSFGVGNIVQVARGQDYGVSSSSVFTVRLSPNHYVWITGSAMVDQETTIQLRDVTADEVLDVDFVKPVGDNITPVFVSYFGKLGDVTEDLTEDKCQPYIWNSFVKRFFTETDKTGNDRFIHEVAIEIVPPDEETPAHTFSRGSVNIVCIDEIDAFDIVYSGTELVVDVPEFQVSLPAEMPSANYSVSIQLDNPVQNWFISKDESSFTIKFDRNFSGAIFWMAVHVDGSELIGVG
jgi:hypothetical protein